jgi:hypothetical protein
MGLHPLFDANPFFILDTKQGDKWTVKVCQMIFDFKLIKRQGGVIFTPPLEISNRLIQCQF